MINSGLYNLKTAYEDIFREKGENCSESVFELQCTATESQPGSNDIGSQFASVQGVDVYKRQGFDGFVVTDYTGIAEMTDHGMGDTQTVAALALNAGVDMDMVSDAFVGTLKKSLTEGKVTEEAINAACRRILEAKYKLGLFDNPYKLSLIHI